MATANLVCGDCGAVLSQGDKFCSQCGARINYASPPPISHAPGELTAASVRCSSCGNVVSASSDYCEACGVRLKPATGHPPEPVPQPLSRPPEKAKPKKNPSPKQKDRKKTRRIERWQLITGVVVLVFAAFFVYTEFYRSGSSPQATNQQQGFRAPSAGMLQEIDELQRSVDANPADTSSLLRLANLLNDAGMTNSSLLMRAVNTYTKYLALKPDDPNARVDMGICYFEMSRLDSENARSLIERAIQEMEKAFAGHPTHQPAAFNLGIVNLNAGDFEESTKWFKKAVEINPNSELGKKAQHLLEEHPPQGPPN